ncbi:chemotaxis protein CheD [Sphingomonas montanisoli]|uniref:Probable chemoreceptor glutamine deamidase CheD n=1 Tax=Sphingomonas montanisoli TaxID=2606412 RepID=A0A5D9C3F0_9SPHN|nr:chemotaxis protein CheD [Sphingomonas montanisoli]TZG26199.1 chemotaxis protein CheD [Sphingomonas montanisoli]
MQPLNSIREQRISVNQGTSRVSRDPTVVLTTVLGSCVACCLYDPRSRVGGMNHFLLSDGEAADERYGLFAMEQLVNAMLLAGATRSGLRAHLYGGANLHAGLAAIGQGNIAFAQDFLQRDRIPVIRSHLGGSAARRVDFRAVDGKVRCQIVDAPADLRPIVQRGRANDAEIF